MLHRLNYTKSVHIGFKTTYGGFKIVYRQRQKRGNRLPFLQNCVLYKYSSNFLLRSSLTEMLFVLF